MKKIISCHIITYNQKDYISKCIEGVLMQKVNFSIEIIIGDDNSTDGTRKILKDYAKKYPDLIRLNLREVRGSGIPGKDNFVTTLAMCNGKYISLCDGDDYWTDLLKLQKQVDFLEANPDYVLCFHKVNILQDGIIKEDTITAKVPETTIITDLAKGNYIHTCSVVFRNNLFSEFPKYFNESPVGDYFLHLLNARYGAIKYIDEIMGVYRVHETSVWSSKTQKERELIWVPFLKNIRPNFGKEVQRILNAQIAFYAKPEGHKNFLWYLRKIKNKMMQKVKVVFNNK